MQVTLKVLRFDPAKDKKPRWETYQVEAGSWTSCTRSSGTRTAP